VPFSDVRENPASLALLESWLKSYEPEKLFDKDGRLLSELRELAPRGGRRMSANLHANGGRLAQGPRPPGLP
jgi:xylulose-5-phosphate/fructose-6-phosphate phosphoketolase